MLGMAALSSKSRCIEHKIHQGGGVEQLQSETEAIMNEDLAF